MTEPRQGSEGEIPKEFSPLQFSGNAERILREIGLMTLHHSAKFLREGDVIWIGDLGKVHKEIAKALGLKTPVDAGLVEVSFPQRAMAFWASSGGLNLPLFEEERARTIELAKNLAGKERITIVGSTNALQLLPQRKF